MRWPPTTAYGWEVAHAAGRCPRGEVVVEVQDLEVKRLATKGLGSGPLSFEVYLERICAEARADRFRTTFGSQIPLPLDTRNNGSPSQPVLKADVFSGR